MPGAFVGDARSVAAWHYRLRMGWVRCLAARGRQVDGYGNNVGQVASDARRQKASFVAFGDFLKNAAVALESVGL